jgi:capsule polysaccharide modification protein KpsS
MQLLDDFTNLISKYFKAQSVQSVVWYIEKQLQE